MAGGGVEPVLSDAEFSITSRNGGSVYLLVHVIIFILLQAADGLRRIREGGTLRVVLGAPEAIFPQLITFCRIVRNKGLY